MLLTNLPDTLRSGGCRVEVDPGFATRGQGQLAGVKAIMCHHTGSVSANTWKVVRDGRAGLQGLLSQLVLERDGLWRVLGSGQAWHAGTGGPLLGIPTNSANAWTIGIEAVSAGIAQGDWTAAQLAEYPRGVAALCRRYGLTEQQVIFHKTWAPGRKVDLAGWPGDLPAFRAAVARHLVAPAPRPPAPTPTEDVMNPEQNRLLVELHQQLVTGPDPGRWGWDAWPGGSRRADGAPDRFTTIDYLRKANQAMEDLRRDVAALRAAVANVPAATQTSPPQLTAADHDAIARRVLALLTEHPLTPKGT